jgi:dUTP pyrophosphatase
MQTPTQQSTRKQSPFIQPLLFSLSSYDHEVISQQKAPLYTHATALIVQLDDSIRLPFQATPNSSGFDVHLTISTSIPPGKRIQIPLGIEICPLEGCYTCLASRSSFALHHRLIVNSGVIDNGYTGELHAVLFNLSHHTVSISHGDRIGHLIFERSLIPTIMETDVLPSTIRFNEFLAVQVVFNPRNFHQPYFIELLVIQEDLITQQHFCFSIYNYVISLTCFLFI